MLYSKSSSTLWELELIQQNLHQHIQTTRGVGMSSSEQSYIMFDQRPRQFWSGKKKWGHAWRSEHMNLIRPVLCAPLKAYAEFVKQNLIRWASQQTQISEHIRISFQIVLDWYYIHGRPVWESLRTSKSSLESRHDDFMLLIFTAWAAHNTGSSKAVLVQEKYPSFYLK